MDTISKNKGVNAKEKRIQARKVIFFFFASKLKFNK